jgi:hypothetical protein
MPPSPRQQNEVNAATHSPTGKEVPELARIGTADVMTMANRKSTTGETDSRTGTAQIDDARPNLVSTTQRRASLPLLRHEVLAAEADEHDRGRGLGIELAHHAVWEPGMKAVIRTVSTNLIF